MQEALHRFPQQARIKRLGKPGIDPVLALLNANFLHRRTADAEDF